MALIKSADTGQLVRDAIVLDLGDLQRQADRIKDHAQEQAEQIVEQAKAERERLIEGAHEKGFEQGRAEGHAQGLEEGRAEGRAESLDTAREDFEKIISAWTSALEGFAARRESLFFNARTEVIALALSIAAKVIKRKVEIDPRVVRDQMASAMTLLRDQTRFVISVHPADFETAEESMPDLVARLGSDPHARIVTDDSIGRGSCVVDTASGRIDASIESQLEVIIESITPVGALGSAREAPIAKEEVSQVDAGDETLDEPQDPPEEGES